MLILGIESSCDETAASIVEDGRKIISNVVFSQIDMHAKFGGVVPEIASRSHVDSIIPVIDECLSKAGMGFDKLDAIAVTAGPGLAGALLVGVSAAKALAYANNKPLYAIHHIASHIAANFLSHKDFQPPFLALVVSGGHSHLIYCSEDWKFNIIGRTVDDASGEALDKIARALGLSYPGGPVIEKLAKLGDPNKLKYPHIKLQGEFDFSFSGLKTCALNYINKISHEAEKRNCNFADIIRIEDFVASYQEAIFAQLENKTQKALKTYNINRFALAGGVAANLTLQERLSNMCRSLNVDFFAPKREFCTDNAAMVAAMAYYEILSGKERASMSLDAKSVWDAETYLSSGSVDDK